MVRVKPAQRETQGDQCAEDDVLARYLRQYGYNDDMRALLERAVELTERVAALEADVAALRASSAPASQQTQGVPRDTDPKKTGGHFV